MCNSRRLYTQPFFFFALSLFFLIFSVEGSDGLHQVWPRRHLAPRVVDEKIQTTHLSPEILPAEKSCPAAVAVSRGIYMRTARSHVGDSRECNMPKRRRTDDSFESSDWLLFYSRSKEGFELSNFHGISGLGGVKVNGRLYRTGESAFHGEKFMCAARWTSAGPEKEVLLEHAVKFQRVGDPGQAKRMGGKGPEGMKLKPEQLSKWDKGQSEAVQMCICRYKVKNCHKVRAALRSSGSRPLLHYDFRAKAGKCEWGGRIDKATGELIGNNRLGKLWMQIREEMRHEPSGVDP